MDFARMNRFLPHVAAVALAAALLAPRAEAETAPKTKDEAASQTTGAADKKKQPRYQRRKQVDFSNQTVEGKVRRPEAALITAGEATGDNGLLRLREDFVDKLAASAAEEQP